MDLTQLKMFCAVVEEGSIARAADRLHRVPSNLTTRLRQLEENLGVDLFIRERQRLRLSPSGSIFLDYAERLLKLADEARAAVAGDQPAGTLALGSMQATAAVHLPQLLARYHQQFPEVSVQLTTRPTGELIEAVLAGQLAAAFVDGPLSSPNLEGVAVYLEELVLVMPQQHAPVRTPADLEQIPLFAFRPTCSFRRRIEGWYREAGLAPARVMEIDSYHTMLGCVAAGSGVACMPRSVLETLPGHEAVRACKLPEEIGRTWTWLAWRKGTRSASLDALVKLLPENREFSPVLEVPA